MQCQKCGTAVDDNAMFCALCGSVISCPEVSDSHMSKTSASFSGHRAESLRGLTPNRDLTAAAREQLRGRYGEIIPFFLVLMGIMSLFLIPSVHPLLVPLHAKLHHEILGIMMVGLKTIEGPLTLLSLILSGPLTLACWLFTLSWVRKGTASFSAFDEAFQRFGRAVSLYFWTIVFVFLWMLCLVIPGILAALSYAMAFPILADNPGMGGRAALRASKEMMKGYRWKFFLLGCRFIGWTLLGILTLGIAYIWIYPYVMVSFVNFYEDVNGRRVPRAA